MRHDIARWLRCVTVMVSWVLAFSVLQPLLGGDLGGATRSLEQRIEQQLERRGARGRPYDDDDPRERMHDEEPIEPWELVFV